MRKKTSIVPEERIVNRIIVLREERVLLDIHLAELYGVETRVLKQAVRRNIERFPDDFMFELEDEEVEQVVSQFVIPSKSHLGGATPFAFTESGVAMLSSVLRSPQAVEMNVAIMRTFVALRKMAASYAELVQRLEKMEERYDGQFSEVYAALRQILQPDNPPRNRIGYRRNVEDE